MTGFSVPVQICEIFRKNIFIFGDISEMKRAMEDLLVSNDQILGVRFFYFYGKNAEIF